MDQGLYQKLRPKTHLTQHYQYPNLSTTAHKIIDERLTQQKERNKKHITGIQNNNNNKNNNIDSSHAKQTKCSGKSTNPKLLYQKDQFHFAGKTTLNKRPVQEMPPAAPQIHRCLKLQMLQKHWLASYCSWISVPNNLQISLFFSFL